MNPANFPLTQPPIATDGVRIRMAAGLLGFLFKEVGCETKMGAMRGRRSVGLP